ncbi:MAG: alginate export family protein [Bacteroidales bacterium]|nr:alginate export family protein [Bacteroidales bacterium]
MKIKLLILLFLTIISASTKAQFEVQGIIRPRFEFRNGYSSMRNDTTTPAAFVSQRSRLNFAYKTDKLETKFSIFDFRVWGDQVWKKDIASMGLHEAWAKINFNEAWSIKLGRQELKYDNSRLISPVNWNQIGTAHDALLIKYRSEKLLIDFGTAWNQSTQNKFGTDYTFSDSYYKSLNFLWLRKKFNKFTISSLNVLDGNQDLTKPELQHFRFTGGIVPEYKTNKFHITARIFGQTGELQNTQKVEAFYTNIDFIYSVSDKIKLATGNEIKSGNNALDSLNKTSKAFDIIYGGRHKFNGRIDYFSIPATTKGAGLIDSYFKANYKFSKQTSLLAEYHHFMLQNNYLSNNTVIDKFLAHEIDFVLKHKLSKDVSFETGYSFIIGTESLEIIKGGNKDLFNHWFYMMLSINPTFFKSKNN